MIESVVSPAELRARRLIFTHDGMPGYRRRRNGKGFSYLLPDGSLLRDASERQRIVSLVIPPAYEAVWICTFPNGHLQATGIDSRGRKQYRYHPDWHALAADKKFELLPAFVRALPRIRRRVRAALSRSALDRERILAGVVALLDATGFRIGSHRYVKENKSFGLASLLSRHLSEEEGQWVIRFKGKSGKEHRADVADAKIASLISELQELPGQHLFQHEDESGGRRAIETTDVNAWLKEEGGGDFTAKQFRTWRATLLCARELGKEPPPDAKSSRKRAETAAIRATAAALNHTLATCRKYYIHPAILRAYRSGELHRVMASRPPRMRKADDSRLLRADERRVLFLLERYPVSKPRAKRA